MALTSWILEFIRGKNLGYDEAYELESIEKFKAFADCTYYIQHIV